MDFDPSTVFPGPGAIIQTIVMGSGGGGGISLLIVGVALAGAAMRPIFILLGMRYDSRDKPARDYSPVRLFIVAIAMLMIVSAIHRPHLAKYVMTARLPIPGLSGNEERHPTGARVCNPETGCNTIAAAGTGALNDPRALSPELSQEVAMAHEATVEIEKAFASAETAITR